ncbi:hypothetical protein [Cryobacterium sp. N22]|uniref:hypothetical protein n=1 Tax=Cryobacterium sp. N22 TaxID=2048290 RepID=UPI0011B02E84|nr:hypothetical protein [Cryobacterium sp. N22]
MGKPQLPAGELGKIDVKRLASGRYRAGASTRDDGGAFHRLAATEETEELARAEVRRQAMALSTGSSGGLAPSSTVAQAVQAWLPQILTRAKTGSLTYSTYESYETTARLVILPRCGGVRLDRLAVGRCDRILQKILEEESIPKARHARAVLSLVCGYAVRDDAMRSNPVRDVQRSLRRRHDNPAADPRRQRHHRQHQGARDPPERLSKALQTAAQHRSAIDGSSGGAPPNGSG